MQKVRRNGSGNAAVAVAIGLALMVAHSPSAGVASRGSLNRARLVRAVGAQRLLQGRPSGGFQFGPGPLLVRGPAEPQVPFEVLRVASQIRATLEAESTPSSLGDLSLAFLLTGDLEKGVKLAEVRGLEEESAAAFNDLSVAHLERAVRNGRGDDFIDAFDAALRALRLQPKNLEARFNKALAADGLGIAWIARASWDDYLAADPQGPWAEVARAARTRAAGVEARNDKLVEERRRMEEAWKGGRFEVVGEIASRRPDLAREILRREGIPGLARARLDGSPVEASLSLALELNRVAEAADHDALDREAIASLVRGGADLASAHVEFAKASQALEERRVDEATPGILHAQAIFRRLGSPYRAQAELQSALLDFFGGRRDGLIERYTALASVAASRYPLLRARALWMRALCEDGVTSNTWQALLDRREAHSILAAAGQSDLARQVAIQLWSSLIRLGRDREAGELLPTITSSTSARDAPLRILAMIGQLTEDLRQRGLSFAALEIRKQTDAMSERWDPVLRVDSAMDIVEAATELDDAVAVRRGLATGEREIARIDDPQARTESRVTLELAALGASTAGMAPWPGDEETFVRGLRERTNRPYLMRALTLVAARRRAEGKNQPAEAALREALALHLEARAQVKGQFERAREFEAAQATADALVDLVSTTSSPTDALLLIEQLRTPGARPGESLARARSSLARDEAILSFWMLNDRVLADVISSDGVRRLTLPIGRPALHRMVRRLTVSLEVGSRSLIAQSLSDLNRALWAPLAGALGSIRKLILIPDRDLWDVPFAGLSPAPGTAPAAARFEIALTASLADLIRPRPAWSPPTSILAVGDARWDKTQAGDLPLLPESGKEARDAGNLYPRGLVLLGADARKSSLERLAPGFDVVHIATHAVANERDPGESFILLAAEPPGSGAWKASEGGWEAFGKVRLIVLSACRTGSERSRFGGVSFGVLRSIQNVSSAEVLVSTGDVEDAASRGLLAAFHRYLRQGHAPQAALRLAQLDARDGLSPTWMLYRIVL